MAKYVKRRAWMFLMKPWREENRERTMKGRLVMKSTYTSAPMSLGSRGREAVPRSYEDELKLSNKAADRRLGIMSQSIAIQEIKEHKWAGFAKEVMEMENSVIEAVKSFVKNKGTSAL